MLLIFFAQNNRNITIKTPKAINLIYNTAASRIFNHLK